MSCLFYILKPQDATIQSSFYTLVDIISRLTYTNWTALWTLWLFSQFSAFCKQHISCYNQNESFLINKITRSLNIFFCKESKRCYYFFFTKYIRSSLPRGYHQSDRLIYLYNKILKVKKMRLFTMLLEIHN